MKVTPDVIDPAVGADVSHDGTSTLSVTITSDTGDEVTIEVPPGAGVRWKPPAGWETASFNATGHAEVFRVIQ